MGVRWADYSGLRGRHNSPTPPVTARPDMKCAIASLSLCACITASTSAACLSSAVWSNGARSASSTANDLFYNRKQPLYQHPAANGTLNGHFLLEMQR